MTVRSTSQPFEATPSQSPWPAVHDATAQEPIAHVALALGSAHSTPHAPQLPVSVAMLVSQPLAGSRSQSA